MMHIEVTDMKTGIKTSLDTDSYVLLHLNKDNPSIKVEGKVGLDVLAPILTKFALEKLVK